MAVAFLVEWSGARPDQYQVVMDVLAGGGPAATGNICQIPQLAELGWRFVDVWESEAAFNAFFAGRLEAIVRAAGIQPPRSLPWPSFCPPGAVRAPRVARRSAARGTGELVAHPA